MRLVAAALALVVTACSGSHGDEPRDAGPDATGTDASVEAGADASPDAIVPDAGWDAGALCGDTTPDFPPCRSEFVPRGAPLDVTRWTTNLGLGLAHRAGGGWSWLGSVRDATTPSRFSEYRIVRTDEHFTSLDTSLVVEGAPFADGGNEFGIGNFLYDPCADEWLALFQSAAAPTRLIAGTYALDGHALASRVDVPDLLQTVGFAATPMGIGFLTTDSTAACTTVTVGATWLDPIDLSATHSPGGAFDARSTLRSGWRSGAWALTTETACDRAAAPELWTVSTAAAISSRRTVGGLPDVGAGGAWVLSIEERGAAIAIGHSYPAPGAVRLTSALIDVDTGLLVGAPTTLADLSGVGGAQVVASVLEGTYGYAVVYWELSTTGSQRAWFVRVRSDGTVAQRTMLVEAIAPEGVPFALRWLGDRYAVGYSSGPADLIDELVCP